MEFLNQTKNTHSVVICEMNDKIEVEEEEEEGEAKYAENNVMKPM